MHEEIKQDITERCKQESVRDRAPLHRRTGRTTAGKIRNIKVPIADRAQGWSKGREGESRKTDIRGTLRDCEKGRSNSLEKEVNQKKKTLKAIIYLSFSFIVPIIKKTLDKHDIILATKKGGECNMECIRLTFDYPKAVQAINFFARKSGGTIDKLKVIKLLFFADRYHLRKYSRLVTNDDYKAMKLGPVGSGIKDIIDSSSFIDEDIREYASKYLTKDDNNIQSLVDVDADVFSKSDLEALTFALNEFGQYDQFKLKRLTHEYPEWKKHEPAIDSGVKQIDMNLVDFFEEPDKKYNPCYVLDAEEKKYNLQVLIEQSQVKAAWD